VEDCFEHGNKLSGSLKYLETLEKLTIGGVSRMAQFHEWVSKFHFILHVRQINLCTEYMRVKF
jgi:hypothetical protein